MRGYVYSWFVDDEINMMGEKELGIRAYMLSEDSSSTYLVHVDGFQPWIYLEIRGDDWIGIQSSIKYELMDRVKGLRKKTFYISYRKKLYYWQEEKEYPFFKIRCSNITERRSFFYQLHDKKIRVKGKSFRVVCHEQDINPLLQFIVSKSLPSAGWIEFNPSPVKKERKLTTLSEEWEVHYKTIKKVEEPFTVSLGVPSPCILSFDLEVYSSNPLRMPDSSVVSDCIFQISCSFYKEKGKGFQDYLLTLGKYPERKSSSIKILTCRTESELLLEFVRLIRVHETNIAIGYNIFGFDIPYLIKRSQLHGIWNTFNQIGFPLDKHASEKKIAWSSSAYSYQEFHFLEAEGRIWIDLLPIIRRDYKFSNYKLKTVATFFLGETKDPLTAKDIFRAYEEGVLKQTEKGLDDLERCGKYCVQDSKLVLKLFNLLNLWIGLSEMARICHVPILDLFTKGQQIKVYSQIFAQCFEDKRIVETICREGEMEKESTYTGAYVFPPEPGVYDWVIPFDFSSLYPTTIIAYNIDYSTYVKDESQITDWNDYNVIEWEDHVNCAHDTKSQEGDSVSRKKKKVECHQHRYIFKKEPKGVIPRLLMHLLEQRQVIKQKLKHCKKEDVYHTVYDKQQLAYKLSANSAYGIMGFQKGYLPFPEGAMSVTAMGRSNIQKAASYVQTHHQGELIYGDSVAADTPIVLMDSNQRCEIDSIEGWFFRFHKKLDWKKEDKWIDLKDYQSKERLDVETLGWKILSTDGWSTVRRIIRHVTKKSMYRVWTTTGCVDVTEDHSLLLSSGDLCNPMNIKQGDQCAVFQRSFIGSDSVLLRYHNEETQLLNDLEMNVDGRLTYQKNWETSKSTLQFLYFLLLQRFHRLHITLSKDHKFQFILTPSPSSEGTVLSVERLSEGKECVVYDIETCDGTFHAGIGNMIVKNTDSIYCHFANINTAGNAWKVAKHMEEKFLQLFPSPMKLVFEDKIYQKFLILTKKRYMAFTCDQKGSLDSELTIRGVLLARRDNCLFVRELYEKVVYQIMNGFSIQEILEWITQRIIDVFVWHPDFQSKKKYFAVSKILNKDYKIKPLPETLSKLKIRLQDLGISWKEVSETLSPSELLSLNQQLLSEISLDSLSYSWLASYIERSKPAHVQLASKCRLRGNPIEVGSRIEYIIIEHPKDPDAKLFEKLEDPDYFTRFRTILRLDRFYYIRLLSTPLDQLLQVSLKLKTKFVHSLYQCHLSKKKCLKQLRSKFEPQLIFVPPLEDKIHRTVKCIGPSVSEPTSVRLLQTSTFRKNTKTISTSENQQPTLYDYMIPKHKRGQTK